MANKHLFPNAKALPPKAPRAAKSHQWKKKKTQPAPEPEVTEDGPANETTTAGQEPTTAVAEPAIQAPAPKPKPTKAKKQKTPVPKAREGMSMIDAAKKVLVEKGEAMSSKEMIVAMEQASYWKSPGGLTPHNTLYSAVLRLLQRDGKGAAFKKADRGMFALNPSASA